MHKRGLSCKIRSMQIIKYVLFRYSHGYGESCSAKTIAPRGCNSAGLVRYKLQELLHIVLMSNESNLKLGDIFSTVFFLLHYV
jgi:hypothetical protein